MQATWIALQQVRNLAVTTGAVQPTNRLITERFVDNSHEVIMMIVELINDYERYK